MTKKNEIVSDLMNLWHWGRRGRTWLLSRVMSWREQKPNSEFGKWSSRGVHGLSKTRVCARYICDLEYSTKHTKPATTCAFIPHLKLQFGRWVVKTTKEHPWMMQKEFVIFLVRSLLSKLNSIPQPIGTAEEISKTRRLLNLSWSIAFSYTCYSSTYLF